MSFFIAPNETGLDKVTDEMVRDPQYRDRYEAISELRANDRSGGTISVVDAARANGFFRVASLQGPLKDLAQVLDPNWLKDKKGFYRWLDKHPQHATYDRRKTLRPTLTLVDGKAVT